MAQRWTASNLQAVDIAAPAGQGKRHLLATIAMIGMLCLTACSQTMGPVGGSSAPSKQETIALSAGPCFGFCPVYVVTVSPDGTVSFSGQKHTAMLGDRRGAVGTRGYQSLARDLAPFRPADGASARVACGAAISDTSSFAITWSDAAGRKTVATHQRGCSDGPGKALDSVLRALPDRLGIAGWAKQITRPGETRG